MEALVAAVDAAGQRAHQRLPITIDGLNEAEDPRNWRGLLASLHETLRQYPYVFVVCTLRTAFTGEALPPDVDRLEISDFGHDTVEAVRRSFAHYRINPADAELPLGLLSIPLTLRLFCEVTNPKREREVGVEAMPRSLTALFDRYLEQAAERIAELAPRTRRYYEQDIRTALDEIGLALWEENTRSLDLAALRRRLSDDGRPWNESIIRALEQEGILLRDPGDTSGAGRVAVLYDALAGHLVADRILTKHGSLSFEEWLKNPATATALVGPLSEQHPLAADIFRALVGLVPRRLHRKQLWQMLDEPLRTVALRGTAELEGAYLDAATVNALSTLVAQPPTESRDLLRQLWQTRSAPTHPLNAEFLDAVLRPMSVADRDLRWTEWVRRYSDELLTDLQRLEKRWRNRTERSSADRLRARWVMWTLTSTVRCLRDQATRAMYWFGRGDLAALFDLTIDALAINDPYISERLLGASYGVTMVHQLPEPKFARVLRAYLTRLRDALTGPSPIHPTSHWLARLYVQGTVTFALTYYPNAVPDGLEVEGRVLFAPGLSIDPIASDDPRASEVDSTLQMDFKNYTLGRLFDDRRNYDMDHAGHKAAVAHVRGTVWTFGWSKNKLGDIDRGLYSYRSRSERGTTERYGKKYGWVGFYTYAGVLDDCRQLPNKRLSDVDIDPTFPEQLPPASINLPIWVRQTPLNDQHWICRGKVAIPDELLYNANIDGHAGPWIAVQGDLGTDRQMLGRRVFGFLTALLVDAKQADRLVDLLNTRNHRGGWLFHEAPSDYYTFAGEIPWSPEFASSDTLDDFPQPYRRTFRVGNGSEIVTETLAHTYGWESHHSQLNTAGGALVPSQLLSKAFDLRGLPQSFNQVLPDGSFAVFSLGAPSGFSGHLLYVREDLLHSYAAGRKLIWFICGRRNLYPFPHPTPGWYSQALQKDADVWQHIRRGEELSRAFASKAQRRFRRSTRR